MDPLQQRIHAVLARQAMGSGMYGSGVIGGKMRHLKSRVTGKNLTNATLMRTIKGLVCKQSGVRRATYKGKSTAYVGKKNVGARKLQTIARALGIGSPMRRKKSRAAKGDTPYSKFHARYLEKYETTKGIRAAWAKK